MEHSINEHEADTVIVALRFLQATLQSNGRTSTVPGETLVDLVAYMKTLSLLPSDKIDALCERFRDKRLEKVVFGDYEETE